VKLAYAFLTVRKPQAGNIFRKLSFFIMDPVEDQALQDAEWAEEEGIPTLDEPFIQKYLDGRDALIEQERQQRSDYAFRAGMTPMQREAAAIVSAIRFEEQQTIWKWDEESNKGNVNVYPGMMFLLAKDRIESGKMWKIVKKMPKGALLHCHMAAMGDLDYMFRVALDTDNFCISSDIPLTTSEVVAKADIRFQHVRDSRGRECTIWTDSYEPHYWVPIAKAADLYPNGGREGFIKSMISRLIINKDQSLDHNLGVGEIWRKFTTCFRMLDSLLLRYEPMWRRYVYHVLTQLNEDGVRWVDFRCDFATPFWSIDAVEPDEDFSGMMNVFNQEVERFKISDEGKGFWGARIIWTSLRMLGTRGIAEDMKKCIQMKQKFPKLIAGYDLVGPEELGRPTVDMVPELFWFKKQCRDAYVDLPFYFHSGETLGTGDEVDENLFDAILLGTRRIGHGFSLYKHPLLIDMVKDKKILVESCPISNEVLRLSSSILSHPLPALLARGVSCALSNDDPSLLGQGSSGMSHDFYQALQGWENLGLEGLASLAENSVRWATFDDCDARQWQQEIKEGAYGDGVRAKRMKEWAMEFERFCQWVVLEFGAEQDINTLD
jgi:adenosine deaminase CECR1